MKGHPSFTSPTPPTHLHPMHVPAAVCAPLLTAAADASCLCLHVLQQCRLIRAQPLQRPHISLVHNHQQRLVGKQGLDAVRREAGSDGRSAQGAAGQTSKHKAYHIDQQQDLKDNPLSHKAFLKQCSSLRQSHPSQTLCHQTPPPVLFLSRPSCHHPVGLCPKLCATA